MIGSRNLYRKVLQTCGFCHEILAKQSDSVLVVNARSIHTAQRQNAGHSHWDNIKHIKAAKDHARAHIFNGLTRRISAAIKDGGRDPKKNSELARVIKICKSQNMPRATLEKCLNAKHDTQEITYGISGPGGSSFVIVCQSSSLQNAKNGMTHALNILSGVMDQQKIEEFRRKRVILVNIGTMDINDDSATEFALDVGAEDVRILSEESGSLLEFICDIKGYGDVEKAIESKDLEMISSKLEYVPNIQVDLTESDLSSVEMFLAALRKINLKSELVISVTDVYHNINDSTIIF